MPLLFANTEDRFFCVKAHISLRTCFYSCIKLSSIQKFKNRTHACNLKFKKTSNNQQKNKIQLPYLFSLTLSLLSGNLWSSVNNLCKQFGPRSGPTELNVVLIWIKPFDTLTVLLKYFFDNANFEKSQQMKTKS